MTAAGGWGQHRTWEYLQGLESKVTLGMLAVVIGGHSLICASDAWLVLAARGEAWGAFLEQGRTN